MQQSHNFCPLCSIELYESQIALISSQEINLETLAITEETLNFLLNPVPLANPFFSNSENEIKVRRVQTEIYGGSLMKKNIQYCYSPYGWDFLIFGLRFLQINQQKSAEQHFDMYLKIRKIVQPNVKCNFVNQMDAEEINILYDQLMENFKVFYMNLHDNNLDTIQKFILKFYEDLIEMLELIQLQITPQTQQLILHKTDTFYKIQLQIAILRNYNNQKYIYTQFYHKYLQNSKTTVLIGMILVKDYDRAQQLWSTFFKSLNEKQQYSHIDSILGIFDSNNQKCQLNDQINLIKIAKEIKKFNQYWLSLMIFSFFRKIYKKQKDGTFHLCYLPFVYVQLAKLSLYLCTLDEALKLYQTAYDKFLEAQNQNIQLYCPNHTANSFQIKILSRIFILKLYLNRNSAQQTAKILQSLYIPYHLNEFISFVLNYLNHCNPNSFASKKYENFFQRTVFQICSVQNQKIIPKKDMIERSNVIELVNKNIPKFQLKKKSSMYGSLLEIIAPSNQSQDLKTNSSAQFHFKQNQNILYNSLMIYYLITANISQDHLDVNEYNRQWNLIELCLQYMDTSVYKMLVPILQYLDQHSHFKFYENLLMSRIHCYICEFELSKQYLQKFNLNLAIWKENKKQCGTHIKLFQECTEELSEIHKCQDLEEVDMFSKKSSKLYKSVTQNFQQNKYYCESIWDSQSRKSSFISTQESKNTNQIEFQFAKSVQMSLEESIQRSMSQEFEGERQDFQRLREFLISGNLDLLLQWDQIMQKQHLFKKLGTSEFLRSKQIKRNLSTTQQSNVVLIELFGEQLVMKKLDISFKLFEQKEVERMQGIFSEIQMLIKLLELKENDQFLKLLYLQFQISQMELFQFTFYLVFPYFPISIQSKQFASPQKQHLTRELLKQVAILHKNRILHLDLKPQNILINDGNPMIIDYGSAQLLDDTRQIQITERYCAPEVLQGIITPKADIYSLGCIIYELFTEQKPEISNKAFNFDLIRSLPHKGIQNVIALATKPYENRGDLEQLLEIL